MMKKTKYIICAALFGLGLTSCEDMDLEPKNQYGEEVLFRSDNGIQMFLARVYNELPIEDFNYDLNGDHPGFGYRAGGAHHGNDYWGFFKGYSGSSALEVTGRGTPQGGAASSDDCYWTDAYARIRDINTLLQNLPNYEADLDASVYENALGEAHFLRAFYYFSMAKRFGGVPLVDEVLSPRDSLENIQLPRNTEYETWKFIHDDLQYAMEHASAERGATSVARGSRYAAAALMSRAMLYAGSVAKYGWVTGITGNAVDAGLQGMDPSYAAEFFRYSYDAAKFLKDAGFALHTGADKESAIIEEFSSDYTSDEDIFTKYYGVYAQHTMLDKSALNHGWDDSTLPLGTNLASNIGCGIQPVYELISLFQMPAITDNDGKPVRFDNIEDLWNNTEMEPRCRATFYFSGMTESASGTKIDLQAGLYTDYPGTTEDGCPDLGKQGYDQPETYNGQRLKFANDIKTLTYDYNGTQVPLRGTHGYYTGLGDEGYSYTGVIIRKYTNPHDYSSRVLFGSSQPFKTFRYGEVVMNWAEAAYELGLETNNESLKQEGIQHANEIRERAGAKSYTYVGSPADVGSEVYGYEVDENLQFIRDERRRELCFENLSYWDFVRWRINDALFQNYKPHILNGYYVANEGKYIFLPQYEEHLGRQLSFNKQKYYMQIPGNAINQNPNLVRNDGY